MPVLSWQGRLANSTSPEEVVAIARDFLAAFTPYELATLPDKCRPPGKLYDGEDLTTFAFELARHNYSCAQDPDGSAALVHKFANFFCHASIRLSEMQARDNSDVEDSRESA